MKKKEIILTAMELSSMDVLSEDEKHCVEACKKATESSWAPYSKFHVGAAALLDNGQIVSGSNQENAAFPSGLCAERVAIFSAHAQYPDQKVVCLAVCARTNDAFVKLPISPCGSCRQVITESNTRSGSPMKVILYGSEKLLVIENSNELLPLGFNSLSL